MSHSTKWSASQEKRRARRAQDPKVQKRREQHLLREEQRIRQAEAAERHKAIGDKVMTMIKAGAR